MRRGAIVTAALVGDYGKPRPVLVIQAELFDSHPSVTVLPISSTLVDAPVCRIMLEPDAENGLRKISQIMVDKAATVPRHRVGPEIGYAGDDCMVRVTRALTVWFGIA